jgi:hypothetical protein
MAKKGVCLIVNDRFSYRLVVDNMNVKFQGIDAVDYFEGHYRGLGYSIEKETVEDDEIVLNN